MKYFNARTMPQGFLKASFKVANEGEVHNLAAKFAALEQILGKDAFLEDILKIGFTSDQEGVGKSKFAEAILRNIFGENACQKYLSGNVFSNESGASILHFDNQRINNSGITFAPPSMINLVGVVADEKNMLGMMPIKSELRRLQQEHSTHFIEWPRGENENVSVLWHLKRNSDQTIQFEFYCTDQIAKLPEAKELLESSPEFCVA